MKREEIPSFGPLEGVKVVSAANVIAGPMTSEMMADWGAELIWIENLRGPDVTRWGPHSAWVREEHRNQRTISMDMSTPDGKEVFLKLIADADIFIESSKPGLYHKLGLDDEVLWEVNPKLVILHISGYGQYVDEKYRGRASYDGIAQAHGGMMYANGVPGDRHPMLYAVGDYYTVGVGLGAVLAALYRAEKTGVGDSIDLAQYEAMIRWGGLTRIHELNYGIKTDLVNDRDQCGGTVAAHCYMCKDGNEVYTRMIGGGVTRRMCEFFDLPYGSDIIPEGESNIHEGTPAGDMLKAKLEEYFSTHTAHEAEEELAGIGLPIGEVLSYENMVGHPLFESNKTLIDFETLDGEVVKTVNVIPRFKNRPGHVWRSGMPQGYDNDDILVELGYDDAEIAEMYENHTVGKGKLWDGME